MSPYANTGILLVLIYLTVIFIFVQLRKNINIGRFSWVGGVMMLALYSFFAMKSYHARQILVTSLTLVWGVRLLWHVSMRHKEGNDPRFFDWQTSWGGFGLVRSFFWIYLCQGLLLIAMATPVLLINSYSDAGLRIWDYVALGLWLFGFYWEAVSDYQLIIFLSKIQNKGKIFLEGLWGLSRHPNYFGEIVQWWAFVLFALMVPYGWLAVIAPITITFYMLFYGGIQLVEKQLMKLQGFEEYKRRSLLLPWLSK